MGEILARTIIKVRRKGHDGREKGRGQCGREGEEDENKKKEMEKRRRRQRDEDFRHGREVATVEEKGDVMERFESLR